MSKDTPPDPPSPPPGRTPTPQNLQKEIDQLREHIATTQRDFWLERQNRLESKIDLHLENSARNDALINQVIWPHTQATMVKLDLILQGQARAEAMAKKLDEVGDQVESLDGQVGELSTDAALVADRLGQLRQDTEKHFLEHGHRISKLESSKTTALVASGSRNRSRVMKAIAATIVTIGSAIAGYISH